MTALFKSPAGKKEILSLYDEKLEELNIDYRSLFVETTFGKTHVIVTGDASNPPLIVVHGSNGCAPISLESYPKLSSKFQVFAIDVLAQPNKSAETRLSMKDHTYGEWMNEIIDSLALKNVVLAGFSFGGLIILKTIIYNAEKVKEVFLASPAYIVNGNPLKALLKIFLPMRRYMKTHKMEYIEKFLANLFTHRDEFAIKYLAKVFLYFDMDFTPVPTLSKDEAKKINTPVTLIAAKNDILFPGIKMIRRAKKLIPSLKQTLLLEESKHVQDAKGNQIVERLILNGK
jgi:pimeloyl-ACP methyl ester carboxylesterase